MATPKKAAGSKKAPVRRNAPKVTSEPVLPVDGPVGGPERDLRTAPRRDAPRAVLGAPGSVSATDVYERRDLEGTDGWFLIASAGLPISS